MTRVFMLIFLCFLSLFIFSSPAPAQNVTGSQMLITAASHDFKEVDEGSVLEHSFSVVNRGSQVLEIKKVNPG